ncbi:MAG: sensor histidine kinase, partial [Verrucomicrobia bacterium]|nr:sensor histidine kinase [Verrucomicrobiota bacterium]
MEGGETVAMKPLAWTPLRISLLLGWIAVILALFAAAALLRGVMKMSERRAAFVSSVTHELRTPLTTFQLYSDMLAGGMVQDEEKRQGYLDTLCLEAGRLNHLIENVLAYSRIERGSARAKHEKLSVTDLLSRFERRGRERV